MDKALERAKVEFDIWRKERKSKNSKTPAHLIELAREAHKTNSPNTVYKALKFRLDLVRKCNSPKKSSVKKIKFVKAKVSPPSALEPRNIPKVMAEINFGSIAVIKVYGDSSVEDLSNLLAAVKRVSI